MKRRWLRILVTSLVLLSIAGFGAFSTFLFNPFEGGFEYDLSTLVPREVDFYASKSDLRKDFDPFPEPAFFEDLAKNDNGTALLNLPTVAELGRELDLGAKVAQLQEALDQLPIRIDVLEVFGGKDAAMAGYFRGAQISEAEWAIYGHANWMGKLGIEMLRYPDLLGLDAQGLVVEEGNGFLQLSGAALPQTVYVTRILDVIVAASSPELVTMASSLEGERGENSFGQSAKYADYIGLLDRDGDELEAFVDYRTLADSQAWSNSWPNPYAEDLVQAIAGRFFQTAFLRDLMGVVAFGGGIQTRMTGLLSSESMNPVQKRFYRQRGFEKARALSVASLVPRDAGFFGYLHGDIGDLLREALSSSSETEVELLDDLARNVWDYSDATLLIDDLDTAFKDRMAFVMRNNDYRDEGEAGPPHNNVPVPAWALILWTDEAEKRDALQQRITNRAGEFGIKGREPGTPGVFENSVKGGYKVREYWSELVDGTGHIATLILDDYFIISNNNFMLGDMVKTYLNIDNQPDYPRLSEDGYFKSMVNTGLANANLLAWFNPREMGETLRVLAEESAREAVFIDWSTERPRIEREILAKHFPGERQGSISPGIQEEFDGLYAEAAGKFEDEIREREVPRLRTEYQRLIKAVELTSGMLFEIGVDQKRFDVYARANVPFDTPEPNP